MTDQPDPDFEAARTSLIADWFDEILESAEKWPDDGPHLQPRQFVRALVRQGRALLSEREAREETVARFVRYADEYPEDIRGPLRDDFLPQLRKIALPATESAQAEADRIADRIAAHYQPPEEKWDD